MNFINTMKDAATSIAQSDALNKQAREVKIKAGEVAKLTAGRIVLKRMSGLTMGMMPVKARLLVEATSLGKGAYDFALANSLAMIFTCIAANLDEESETKAYLEAACECATYAGVSSLAESTGIEEAIDQFLLTPELKKALNGFVKGRKAQVDALPEA